MRERAGWLTLLCAAFVLAAPTLGEDVYLKNGRVFRGVVAETVGNSVRIQMPGGDLSLPMSSVLRVEASGASYRDFLNRRDALKKSGGTAAEWVDLARWAMNEGIDGAAREAALVAARFDPRAPGLQPLLGELGFVLDAATGGYVPFEDAQARQGLVYSDGAWIPSVEREARSAQYRAERGREALAQQATAERDDRQPAPAMDAQQENDSAVGIPLQYAYGGSSYAPNGYATGLGYGGSYPSGGGLPWVPQHARHAQGGQRGSCGSCTPVPQRQSSSVTGSGRREQGSFKPFQPLRAPTAPGH